MLRFLKSFIRRHPSLYFTLTGWRKSVRRLRAYKDSELVVEGFPRSANTTSMYSLYFAQGENFKVGHHLHVAAHVAYAVKHSIPCLVVVRQPVDCIASLLVMRKGGDPASLLKDYIDFSKVVLDYSDKVIIADFDQITKEGVGSAICRVNEKFGTSFLVPEHSVKEREWVEEQVRNWNEAYSGGDEEKLSMPTAAKKERKALMLAKIEQEPVLLQKANEYYKKLTEHV